MLQFSWLLFRSLSYKTTECDGIPEEPNATDEDYNKCKLNFPPSATIRCNKPGIFNNLSIEIQAVHCNGFGECLDGEDEAGCDQDYTTELLVTLGVGFIFTACLSCFILWSLRLKKCKFCGRKWIPRGFNFLG